MAVVSADVQPLPTHPANTWHTLHSALIVLITAAIVGLMIGLTYVNRALQSDYRLLFWLITWALMVSLFLVAGHGINARWSGALIDESNRMSISRLQILLWSSLVLSAVATAVASNVAAGGEIRDDAFNLNLPTELWILMGISTASLAGSAFLNVDLRKRMPSTAAEATVKDRMSTQQQNLNPADVDNDGQLLMLSDPSKATFGDLFKGDGIENADHVDLGKVQMFFFTMVLVLTYALLLGEMFVKDYIAPNHMTFPGVDESMVALLGISHAGFLSAKAASNPSRKGS